MKRNWLYLLMLAFAMLSCEPNLTSLLPQSDDVWEVERMAYELTWDFSLLESTNNDTAGTMLFLENGRGFWDNGKVRMKNEIILGDSFRWEALDNKVEILFDLEQEEIDQENNRLFEFQVIENERNRQVWRHENEFPVFNPQIRDSSDARLIWQWQLIKN